MDNFLGGSVLERLVTIGGATLFLFVLTMCIRILRPTKVKLPGGTEVDMTGGGKTPQDERREADEAEEKAVAVAADTFYLVTLRLKEINDEIAEVLYREILSRQMAVAERELDRSIAKMREVHLDLLAERLGDEEARRHDVVDRYEMTTDVVRGLMKDRIRIAMRDNHFLDKSEMEFRAYITEKLEEYYQFIEQIVDHGYKHEIIKIKDLRAAQRAHIHEYGAMISSVFIQAREIAKDCQEKVKCLSALYARIQRHYAETGEYLYESACGDAPMVLPRDKGDE